VSPTDLPQFDKVRVALEDRDPYEEKLTAAIELSVSGLDGLETPEALEAHLLNIAISGDAPFHRSEVRSVRADWGGSFSPVDVTVWLGGWLLSSAAWDLMKAAIGDLARRSREANSWPTEPLDRAGAIGLARWKLAARYETDADALEVVREEQTEDGRWRFNFEEPNGRRFEIELIDSGGLAVAARTVLERP